MQPKTKHKVIDALMALAAERPWRDVTLEALAERAGVPLKALRSEYDGRLDVLADFVRRLDESVLAGLDKDMSDEGPRERLFDVLFSRIEALAPYRPAIGRLSEAARCDPLLALELNRLATISMAWMLTAAGIRATGGLGGCRAQGLALVWARVLRVWLNEEDPALPRTMAELDRRLREAERMVIRLDRLCRILRPRRRSRARYAGPPAAADLAEGHPS